MKLDRIDRIDRIFSARRKRPEKYHPALREE